MNPPKLPQNCFQNEFPPEPSEFPIVQWSQETYRELGHDGEAGASAPETKPEVSVVSCGHTPPSAIGQDLEAVCRDYGQATISQHCLQ